MVISIHAGKAFDKIWHHFIIKTLNDVGKKKMYLTIIKVIYEKPSANIILKSKMSESFSTKIMEKTRVPILITSIQEYWKF